VTAQKNTLPETLIERVEKLVQANKEPILSTTPVSVAVGELAARTEALEEHHAQTPQAAPNRRHA